MTHITHRDRPQYWLGHEGTELVTGVLGPGEAMLHHYTDVVVEESETAYVAALPVDELEELPDSGWLEVNRVYQHNGVALMVRLAHHRTHYEPSETPNLFTVYRADADATLAWIASEQVQVGTLRTNEGVTYKCLQAHVTQSDWTPPATPALWAVVAEEPQEPDPPTVPAWAQGVYALNDLVTHLGRVWRSLMNANGYEPSKAGTWRDQSDPPLWVAPSGSVGLWHKNDRAVHQGAVWVCQANNNAYAPGVWGWVRE